MLTVLGIVSIFGAIYFGSTSGEAKMKGVNPEWMLLGIVTIVTSRVIASLICLFFAYLCFGGTL